MELAWILVAAGTTFLIARSADALLGSPALRRKNYAGRDVQTGGGMIAVFGFLIAVGARELFDFVGSNWQITCVALVGGFAAIGLFDDVIGSQSARGLRGHARAALRGELTSGALKLVVGVGIAFVATVPFGLDTEGRILCAVIVAGSANVANLFDLAPGRLTKVAVVAAAVLAGLTGSIDPVIGPLMFLASVVVLLPAEMSERLMLGDAGANALGAALGLLAISASDGSRSGLWVGAGVVVAINLAGEVISFSRVIDRLAPLRALDRMGRRR